MQSTLILSEADALRLRIAVERGIQAIAIPDVAAGACRNQKRLHRELAECERAETSAFPDEDELPMAVGFSMQPGVPKEGK